MNTLPQNYKTSQILYSIPTPIVFNFIHANLFILILNLSIHILTGFILPFSELIIYQYRSDHFIFQNMNHRGQHYYDVTADTLSDLFQPDNVRNGESLSKLLSLGGIPGIEKALVTNTKTGIPRGQEEFSKRIEQFGDNQPIFKPPKTIWEMILQNFEDDMLKVLCAAAIISLILGIATEGLREGWIEGMSIICAVIIIVSVTSFNNYVKQKQFQKLNTIAQQKNIDVVRGGETINISVYKLMVGDLVEIVTGEILSVDGLLVQGNNISADQSSMTGQSHYIEKEVPKKNSNDQNVNPFLISGSKIMQGTGSMIVLAVGKNSQYGKLKMQIQAGDDQTPLQQKLSILATQVGKVGVTASVLTFSVMMIHFFIDCFASGNFTRAFMRMQTINIIVENFIVAVTIIVVAIPQGLPLAVTIALAYSVGKMKDENNLVRYLQACETMGGVNNICTDKTGTLTKNMMTVTRIFVEEKVSSSFTPDNLQDNTRKILSVTSMGNTNANPIMEVKGNQVISNQIGNKTECALLEMALKYGYNFKNLRKKDNMLKIFPFSSQAKKMTTIYKDNNNIYVCTKGAPEYLLHHCNQFIDSEGRVSKINANFEKSLKQNMSRFANQSLRTLLLCYKELEEFKQEEGVQVKRDDYENDLTIVAMVGIKDPLREGIAQAVQKCHIAGVTVRMVTGDNKQTAIAIAKQAGILDKNWKEGISGEQYEVMEGKAFREFVGGLQKSKQNGSQNVGNIEKFKIVQKQLRVLARSSPEDKYIMATGLKQLEDVVAMTGDGTNDAPALKKADIGFAMGIAGTQVAKQASGIILLDDNFTSIVTAMKWGRNIFDCIRKFLQFQLTINFVALVMAFLGACVIRESPLNAVQMLWINLIMDSLASLALATEPPSQQLLLRKPYSRYQNLITPSMWRNIITQGLFQIVVLCIILFRGPQIFNIPSSIGVQARYWNSQTGKHYALFFNIFVLMQLFNMVNARKLQQHETNVFKNFFNNPLFLGILIVTFIVQFSLMAFGGSAIRTVPLTLQENMLCFVVASMSLFSSFLFKVGLPKNIEISSRGFQFSDLKFYWKPKEEVVLRSRANSMV